MCVCVYVCVGVCRYVGVRAYVCACVCTCASVMHEDVTESMYIYACMSVLYIVCK